MKKTVKFCVYWGFVFAMLYLWLEKGMGGAFNVLAVWLTVVSVMFLLANFISEDRIAEIARMGKTWRAPIDVVFSLVTAAALLWMDVIWLGALYLCSYGLIQLRFKVALDGTSRA